VVLFSLFLAMATGSGAAREQHPLGVFVMVFFGGLVAGAFCGLLSAAIARLLANPAATSLLLVFTAFGSFYVAEHLLHVSGIMSVVASALIVRGMLSEVEDTVAKGVAVTWDWLGLFLNSVLFVIMGLVITVGMFREQWLAMLIAIVAALLARASAVAVCGLVTRPFKHPVSLGWQLLLFWGGLRGAIAVALVLALPVELDYWYTVQSMVFGVVLFSMLVQGTTNKPLIARFGNSAVD
jgi:CPA1 family monovalent cation:H+ antiporter